MKVLINKYELRSISERWPDFESCPDFVEVAALIPSVRELTEEEQKRLSEGIVTAIARQKKRKPTRSPRRHN